MENLIILYLILFLCKNIYKLSNHNLNMKKRMDKKGQLDKWFIPLIVMVIAAILVILFFSGAFGTFGEVFEKFSSVEIAAQACGGYASAELKTSYCNLFQKVEISGTKQYTTCEYLESYAEFERLSEECDAEKVELLAIELCETLKDEGLVNGRPCYVDGEGEDEWGISREHLSE